MFFIWGHRTFKKIMLQTPEKYKCGNCNNVHAFQVIKISKWFTFFFIPIFPYSIRYFEMCPICNRGTYIWKADVKKMIENSKSSMIQGDDNM